MEMALDLNTEEFEDMLKEQYGVTSSDFMKRIQEVDQENRRQIERWRDYLAQARQDLCLEDDTEPIRIISAIQKICDYERILDLRHQSLCQQFKTWKTNDSSIASMLSKLQLVKTIPREGLDNLQLEGILEVFQNTFGGVQLYRPQTRDFMYCDVQRRFTDPSYPSAEQMDNIQELLPLVDSDGEFKKHQVGILRGSPFGELNAYELMDSYTRGFDLLAIIINTCACDAGGQHWVSIVISHQTRTVEIFDSTGQYANELKPVVEFCSYLANQCAAAFGTPYTVVSMMKEVQRDTNTCGIFALFYIYARILGVEPQTIFQTLIHNKSNSHIRLFKQIMFGA